MFEEIAQRLHRYPRDLRDPARTVSTSRDGLQDFAAGRDGPFTPYQPDWRLR